MLVLRSSRAASGVHRVFLTVPISRPAGNIVGSLAAALMLKYGWGWSFVVPGVFIIVTGECMQGGGLGRC